MHFLDTLSFSIGLPLRLAHLPPLHYLTSFGSFQDAGTWRRRLLSCCHAAAILSSLCWIYSLLADRRRTYTALFSLCKCGSTQIISWASALVLFFFTVMKHKAWISLTWMFFPRSNHFENLFHLAPAKTHFMLFWHVGSVFTTLYINYCDSGLNLLLYSPSAYLLLLHNSSGTQNKRTGFRGMSFRWPRPANILRLS